MEKKTLKMKTPKVAAEMASSGLLEACFSLHHNIWGTPNLEIY